MGRGNRQTRSTKICWALAGQRAKKGLFITTSNFTEETVDYARQMDTKIVLIDGEKLLQYMIDYNLGVSVQNVYEKRKLILIILKKNNFNCL